MVLNERELQMARELAGQLIMVQDKKKKEDLLNTWNNFKNSVVGAWKSITDVFNNAVGIISNVEKENDYRNSWHVPKSIIKNHQVMNRKPLFTNIRNNL